MTREQGKLALELINNPPPGSALAAAKDFGVDLTLLISALRRTTTERARALAAGAKFFDAAKRIPLAH